MGYGPKDKLNIVSLNSQRRGLQSLPNHQRPTYYQELFEKAHPDICFLPGDDEGGKLMAIQGYGQYLVPNNEGTVLLYDNQHVQMKQQSLSLNSLSGDLPMIDLNQMVVPDVEVSAPKPYNTVVKEFSLVSWKYDYLQSVDSTNGSLQRVIEQLIIFSQRLGLSTGRPILIGGELNISYEELTQIVKKLSNRTDKEFLDEMQPIWSRMNFLPGMTKTALRDDRHVYKMDVVKCNGTISRSKGIVNTWEASQSNTVVADCFIASKKLELAEATLLDVESLIGRKVCVPLQTYKPTQTYVPTPVRPPKHHGG